MLAAFLGERPFAVLPYIEGAHERRTQLVVASGKWLAFAAMLGVAVVVGHQYADPISDLLRHFYY
jgi:putative Ca2+/H+ antiporter (TMEM165/GDT1 family)